MSADRPERSDWFQQAGWGVMVHYIAEYQARDSSQDAEWDQLLSRGPTPLANWEGLAAQVGATRDVWNGLIDGFDVEGLASQLAAVGAGYFFLTLNHATPWQIGPNETYDRILGRGESFCSRRDLVSDLYEALAPRGIKLLTYTAAIPPSAQAWVREAFDYEENPHKAVLRPPSGVDEQGRPWGSANRRLESFQRKWESVLREWGERWGDKVAGWWVDCCYWWPDMYEHPDAPNWESFAAALRAGNSARILGFNPGQQPDPLVITPVQDYAAGEMDNEWSRCRGRWAAPGVQWQGLTYLGKFWGAGPQRVKNDFAVEYTQDVLAHQGVLTWDVPILPSGLLDPEFLPVLRAVGEATR